MTPAGGRDSPVQPLGAGSSGAAIDVGSNSVLLLVLAVDAGGRARVVDEALATTRLGSGLAPGGALAPEACRRTREAVGGFVARARAAGAGHVWAFATGAVREATDGNAFARDLAAATGIPIEVLSGEREARLAYAAAAAGHEGTLLVVDVGGRTSELTLGAGRDILAAVSLPLGALALTECHLRTDPPAATEVAALEAAVEDALGATPVPASARAAGARLAASGGTATALAALDLGLTTYDPRRLHGHMLPIGALETLCRSLTMMPSGVRATLPGLDPDRAAILPAGAIVLARVAAGAGATAVRVSNHGVRHAYLAERLAGVGIATDMTRLEA